jgi:hypothetical protein
MTQVELCPMETDNLYQPCEAEQDNPATANTIRLQIGDVCCAFSFRDEDVYHRLKEYYRVFLTENEPDITMELEGVERFNTARLTKAIARTKYHHDGKNNFQTSSKIMSGRYDLAKRFIKIKGERGLADPDSKLNHLNRMVSISYYTACRLKYGDIYPAMLLHGCGILRNGHVLVFTGPSGVGKTTLAGLCGEQDGEVINDEMVLVNRPDVETKEILVRSVPIVGAFPCRRRITAPLQSILLLKQSDKTSLRRLEKTEDYMRLMRQIISPAYIGQMNKRAIITLIADFSLEIISYVPVFELECNLEKELLWKTVAEAEKMTNKEVRR